MAGTLREFRGTLQETLSQPLPGEFWQHARAACKERLLAARSPIDAKITYLERQQERAVRETTNITDSGKES